MFAQTDFAGVHGEVERLKGQQRHVEESRDALALAADRLRESSKLEEQRLGALEGSYYEAERRLKAVREEASGAEQELLRLRQASLDEERAVAEKKRHLRIATEELSLVQSTIADQNRALFEERSRALSEIGKLSEVRQSAQSQVFLLAEAQRRMQQRGPAPVSSSSPDGGRKLLSDVSNKEASTVRRVVPPLPYKSLQAPPPQSSAAGVENDRLPEEPDANSLQASVLMLRQQAGAVLQQGAL